MRAHRTHRPTFNHRKHALVLSSPSTAFPLIDIGANLTNKAFKDDTDAVIARARDAGVIAIGVTGTSVPGSRHACELARARPDALFATAGVHPHHASAWTTDVAAEIRALATLPEARAVGECGLDYNRDFSPRDAQRRAFEAQLDIAIALGKPVFLHERDAADDFVSIISEHRARLSRAVVHCFTGTRETLARYVELDLYIGITGWICDERRGLHLAEAVRIVPRGRLMIETDAPYLIPRTMKKRPHTGRNEPAFLPHVLAAVARARDESLEDCAAHTTATARELFALHHL